MNAVKVPDARNGSNPRPRTATAPDRSQPESPTPAPSLDIRRAHSFNLRDDFDEFRRETAETPRDEAGPDLASILAALRRRLLLGVLLGLALGAPLAALVWSLVPASSHRATALFLVKPNPQSYFTSPQPPNPTEIRRYIESQTTRIKSEPVLKAALYLPIIPRDASIRQQPNPVAALQKLVEVADEGDMIRLSATMESADEVARVVNAVAAAYLEQVVNREKIERLAYLESLKKTADSLDADIRRLLDTLRSRLDEAGGLEPEERLAQNRAEAQLVSARVNEAKLELLQLQTRLRRVSETRTAPETGSPDDSATLVPNRVKRLYVERALAADRELANLESLITAYEERLRNAEAAARDKSDPEVQKIRSHVASLREQREARRLAVGREAIARAEDERREKLELAAADPRAALDDAPLAERAAAMNSYVDELNRSLATLADEQRRLVALIRLNNDTNTRVEAKRKTLAELRDKIERLDVDIAAPSRVELYQEASAVRTGGTLKRAVLASAALFASVASALALLTLLEYASGRVTGPREVSRGLGLRILGAIPADAAPWRPLVHEDNENPDAPFAAARVRGLEAIDSVRAAILHRARAVGIRVLAVTSAHEGEGKTTVATALADSLARAGRNVLLVDANLRNPAVVEPADLEIESESGSAAVPVLDPEAPFPSNPETAVVPPGLAEILRGESSLADAVLETPPRLHGGSLHVIHAGRVDDRAVDALGQERFARLIRALAEHFDFVVVDTAPVLPYADALHVASAADAVVLAVARGLSRLPDVHAACLKLMSISAMIVGAVILGAQPGRDHRNPTLRTRTHAHAHTRSNINSNPRTRNPSRTRTPLPEDSDDRTPSLRHRTHPTRP